MLLEQDANIVDWNAENDAANPHNWPGHKRWAHVILVAVLALVSNMAPAMCAPGIHGLMVDFNISSQAVSTLAITLYVLGIAIGPMFMSPLSEVYGRLPVYHMANLAFVAFMVGSAMSKNIGQFMVFRFISGCAGGTPIALGGGTIADVTPIEKRGVAMALFSLGPLAGPVLGPVIGGFVAAGKGWRWTFWLLAILGGAIGIAMLIVMRETQPKVLLERKAARLRASTCNTHLRSMLARSLTPRQVLVQALGRPVKLLLRSPVLLVISLYLALVFGLMYLLFTTFTDVFEGQYGFRTSISGLVYLGLGFALVTSMVLFTVLNDRVWRAWMKAEGVQRPRPEHRLVLMICFSPFAGVGLFIYGWTAYYKVHWIVPIIGTVFIGFGAFFVIMPAQLYLVDLFGSEAAASALGANNLLRYLSSTFLPLAGPGMYRALNYGWGNTLLGFLALGFVPAPVLLYKYGEWLRARDAVKF
ncbi:fluconazole resistance protein 1 [Xylona heveae TC161]|uniref:Fluconazole resistance protein 1 n=1 Tax=Xylona heveae (strain CBS 132557 / TC161) TaxID=1328760 RepID=A0A164ZU44_XYLHT|nr:fluconazole resistance protein 1 [Xylona heveae TC161]KZF19519.1 fluconazole resistance protein 1 [Xylona heveae TC161]